jgi:hypothetical protein
MKRKLTVWIFAAVILFSALQNGEGGGLVPSMLFTHVPVSESITAWEEAHNDGRPNEKYHYGNLLSGKATFRSYLGKDKLFDKAVELGSTKAMFFGHYHDNDYSVDYRGIRLTAGQMSSHNMDYRIGVKYNALYIPNDINFTRLFTYGDNRGGTLITMSADTSFSVSQALAREVIADYSDWAMDYEKVYAEFEEENKIPVKR